MTEPGRDARVTEKNPSPAVKAKGSTHCRVVFWMSRIISVFMLTSFTSFLLDCQSTFYISANQIRNTLGGADAKGDTLYSEIAPQFVIYSQAHLG